MGKVQDSLTRLEEAITRLERAARRDADGVNGKDVAGIDTVAKRLDAVIGRIDRVLEG